MKITKGEHYIIRVMDENVKVEITKIVKVGEDKAVLTYKTEGGSTFFDYADDFKRKVDHAAEISLEEVSEIEV